MGSLFYVFAYDPSTLAFKYLDIQIIACQRLQMRM